MSQTLTRYGSRTPNMGRSRIPAYTKTEGDVAIQLAGSLDEQLFDWQKDVLNHILAVGDDGRPACTLACLAVPRQNGKNFVIELVEVYLTAVKGLRILHTAHALQTADESFARLVHYFERYPFLAAEVREIRRANGEKRILLKNGGFIKFSARTEKAGRGLTCDVLVFDEAQHMGAAEQAALKPIIATSRRPLTLVTGTPPTPRSASTEWSRMRDTAAAPTGAANEKMLWLEWSAADSSGTVDIEDPDVWATANPSLGHLIHEDTIAAELAALDEDAFMRERLGMWTTLAHASTPLPMDIWDDLLDADATSVDPQAVESVTLAVDVSPARDRASITAAIRLVDDNRAIIDVVESRVGTLEWVPARLAELVDRYPVTAIVVDSYGPAESLIQPIERRGIGVNAVRIDFVAAGTERFLDACYQGRIMHGDQAALRMAVAGVKTRSVGDGRLAFGRKTSDCDVTPLVAAVLAHGALDDYTLTPPSYIPKPKKRPDQQKKRNYTQKVVAL